MRMLTLQLYRKTSAKINVFLRFSFQVFHQKVSILHRIANRRFYD